MLIKIIVVGKLKDRAIQSRCDEYCKWLRPYAKLEVVELPDATPEREGQAILKALDKERGHIFMLSEEGREFTSEEFAAELGRHDCKMIFVIGGPLGLTAEAKARGDLLWSLSRLTFTHEMARFLLCEQLYRAVTILHGGKYHNP